jgi:hypothetical protein
MTLLAGMLLTVANQHRQRLFPFSVSFAAILLAFLDRGVALQVVAGNASLIQLNLNT